MKILDAIDLDGIYVLNEDGCSAMDAYITAGNRETKEVIRVRIPRDRRGKVAHQLMGGAPDEMVMLRRRRRR